MALESAGHGLELDRITGYMTGFDGRPGRGLHTGQGGRFFQGLALRLTDFLDTAAEKPGVDLMAGGSEGGLRDKLHDHMSIDPESRAPCQGKERPSFKLN
jgi:hypothetical protein